PARRQRADPGIGHVRLAAGGGAALGTHPAAEIERRGGAFLHAGDARHARAGFRPSPATVPDGAGLQLPDRGWGGDDGTPADDGVISSGPSVMSYYTALDLTSFDERGNTLSDCFKDVLDFAKQYYGSDEYAGFSLDYIIEDITELIQKGQITSINHWDDWLEPFLLELSNRFPKMTIGLRGMGEEFEDLWIAWYRKG